MADLTKMSDQALQKEIEQATKVRSEIEKADSREIVRAGKADETLARLQAAGDTFKAAKAELARRAEGKRDSLRATATFDDRARQQAQMNDWAMDPTPAHERPGRRRDPDPYEPVKKVFHLLRNGLPRPLLPEDLDGARLSVEEGQELYDLTLRATKGAMTASEAPRWEALLEKTAASPAGSIEAARKLDAERQAQEAEQAAAAREAERQRAVERERWLTEIGAPR